MTDLADILTIDQAAELLGVARRTIYKYFARGLLTRTGRLGNTPYLSRADVSTYKATRKVGRPSEKPRCKTQRQSPKKKPGRSRSK